MASSIANKGEEYSLKGDGSSNGSIARLATAVRLYTNASVPIKAGLEGVDFIQAANGNGYLTGGHTIGVGNWTFSVVATIGRIVLADQVWTASGGSILNIAGAYIVDAGNLVLAWWERGGTVTLLDGETYTLDDLTIRLG